MKAVIVYESIWGNTRQVAEAVADGLREAAEVAVHPVAETPPGELETADLLVVGGPTHAHGMASRWSHKAALEDKKQPAERLEPNAEGPALRDWFQELGKAAGARGAAFDTRIGKPKALTGSAAKGIAQRLRRHGYTLLGEESFIVEDTAGPLREGELDRARAWGKDLAETRR
jgi:flavodoxin-like protein